MRIPIYQLDAFATRRFTGNPAAVMPLDRYFEDHLLQAIAAENNLAETAFIVPDGGDYRIRWFTPTVEVPLCGHATLASAAVVMERLEPERCAVLFHSASGPLTVSRAGSGYVMNFPIRPHEPTEPPDGLADALGAEPIAVFTDPLNYLALMENAAVVRGLAPDMERIRGLGGAGVIVTAAGDERYDFVSRYFAPNKGINEDPVTGGAHCTLAPFWSERTGKDSFRAYQASPRGGELLCRLAGDRVDLEGSCIFYMEGIADL